jgi:hypothetical protein
MTRHLLSLTDTQMTMLLMAATPLPQHVRDKFLRAVAYQYPVNDTALVDAITVALAAIGYAEDGSMLITQTNKSAKFADLNKENDYDQTTAAAR